MRGNRNGWWVRLLFVLVGLSVVLYFSLDGQIRWFRLVRLAFRLLRLLIGS